VSYAEKSFYNVEHGRKEGLFVAVVAVEVVVVAVEIVVVVVVLADLLQLSACGPFI
jgi:hypothetical protein